MLELTALGDGPRVLLVHGSVVGAQRTWRHQLPLAERFTLLLVSRPGFGGSPPLHRGDFEAEAPLIADALGAGAHLVDAHIANGQLLYDSAARLTPPEFLRAFRGGVGSSHATPPELDAELLAGTQLLMRERPPWEADPPLEALAQAQFHTLVISGGHSPVFESVCNAVATRLGAERAVVGGRGHTIPATGEPYNQRLRRFLRASATGC